MATGLIIVSKCIVEYTFNHGNTFLMVIYTQILSYSYWCMISFNLHKQTYYLHVEHEEAKT